MPVYFVWLKYLSWFKYGFEALIINQFKGAHLGEYSLQPPLPIQIQRIVPVSGGPLYLKPLRPR